jgi:hypothetical protein
MESMLPYIDPELCSCTGTEPCYRCGAHVGCPCHSPVFDVEIGELWLAGEFEGKPRE